MNKRGGGQITGNYGLMKRILKRLKTNEESLRELWDNVKRTHIHIIGVPEGEERQGHTKHIPRDNSQKLPSHGKGTTHSNPGGTMSTI